MYSIEATNVNDALPRAIEHMMAFGKTATSRNGPVIYLPKPLAITYARPDQRVLFNPYRDANPFFHFMESLWMLAGRNDVEWLAEFLPRIAQYSDDGKVFNGAYGYRWRRHFCTDQLKVAIHMLRRDKTTRRVVIQMFDPDDDLGTESKDVPCNTCIYLDCQDDRLNMTVSNRSNDLIWGMLGANAVHFSVLQQFIAQAVGVPMGRLTQFSNNVHVYTDVYPQERWPELSMLFPYESMLFTDEEKHAFSFAADGLGAETPWHALSAIEEFVNHAHNEKTTPITFYGVPILEQTAIPMLMAWRKRRTAYRALAHAALIQAPDWRRACTEWLQRRYARIEAKKAKTNDA